MNAVFREGVRGFQHLKQGYACRNHGYLVSLALPQHFRSANWEGLAVIVDNRGLWPRGAQKTKASRQAHLLHELLGCDSIARVEHDRSDDSPHHGKVLQPHLRTAVLTNAHADV